MGCEGKGLRALLELSGWSGSAGGRREGFSRLQRGEHFLRADELRGASGHGAAVAAGVRGFEKVVVVADTAQPISPCGACRQVLAEFGVKSVILANRTERLVFSLEELLPRASTGILDRP